MKECELCSHPARMYCESDQASLCWDCDAKVHGANFLVARHSRCLLCQNCQTPTAWKASGAKLGSTVSVCQGCVTNCNGSGEIEGEDENDEIDEDDADTVEDEDDEGVDSENEEEEEEEEGENQVVPWSSSMPPPVTSSSSCEGSGDRFASSGKRMTAVDAELRTQDVVDISSFGPDCASAAREGDPYDEAISLGHSRRKEGAMLSHLGSAPGQSVLESNLLGSARRLEQARQHPGNGDGDSSASVLDLRRLGKRARTVDLIAGSTLGR